MMIETTKSYLKRAKCYHMANSMESTISHAEKKQLSYLEFLNLLLEHEMIGRDQNTISRLLKMAKLPSIKTFDEFDYSYQQSITKQQVKEWLSFVWLEQRENIILMGPPGVGKTHVVIALAYEAIKAGYKVGFYNLNTLVEELLLADARSELDKSLKKISKNDLIIIDELGYLPMKDKSASLFFQLINHLYEFKSIAITSNRLFNEWGVTFSDNVIATAILDRLLHHAQPITMLGDSFRLKHINQ
jgi:DNA replication protein DnaC